MARVTKPRSLSPKGLRTFGRARTALIRNELELIGYSYCDVDQGIVDDCDRLLEQVAELEKAFDVAVEEGRGAE